MGRSALLAAAAALGWACASTAAGLELFTAPHGSFTLYPATSGDIDGLYDLVVPAVGVRAGPGEQAEITGMRLELWRDGAPALVRVLSPDRLVADTRGMARLPVPALISGGLLNADGTTGFFGAETALSDDARLVPNEALVTTRHAFITDFEPDFLRIVVLTRAGETETRVPVSQHQSTIRYRFPLEGVWFVNALPTIQSHHRFFPPTEFGIDIFKVERQGLARGDNARGAAES